MKFAESLKEIRIMRGLSQREFCKDVLSPSCYSRFEKGNGSLTMNNLIALLQKHQLSPSKYLSQFYPQNFKRVKEVEDRILQAFITKDIASLKETKEKLTSTSLLGIIVQDGITELENKRVINITYVKKELFRLENYDDNFLWFVMMALLIYSKDNFEKIVINILKKYANQKTAGRELEILASITVMYLERPFSENKEFALHFLRNLPANEDIFLSKVIEKYFTAKFNGQTEEAQEIKSLIIDLKIKGFPVLEKIIK